MDLILDTNILYSFVTVLSLIVIKTVLTWIIAFQLEEFDIREAPRFLVTNVYPYLAGLLVLAIPSLWIPSVKVVYYAVTAAVISKYFAEIKDRAVALYKIEIPDDIAS